MTAVRGVARGIPLGLWVLWATKLPFVRRAHTIYQLRTTRQATRCTDVLRSRNFAARVTPNIRRDIPTAPRRFWRVPT